jgi:hypothetical protein
MERGIELRMFVESDAVPKTGEAIGKLCPKDEASADRKSGVDRPEGADMLGHDLTAGTSGLD